MATRTAKLRVQVDGEKEYKQAISEINKGNQVLASEMRKLQAEYKGNESSIEALNAKGDLLQRQLLTQKDKVQTLQEALQHAADQYGLADKRTQEWQIKLNDAEAAQIKLENAIKDNNEAIKNQGQALDAESEKMVSLGDAVDQVAGKLGVRLPDGAKKALNGMQGMSAGSVAALGAIAGAVAVTIKAIKELQDVTLEAAANADELITQSMVSGLSTETLQQWQYAENLIDVSAATITGALTKLTNKMYDAYTGNEAAAESFETLGVSIRENDGTLRDAESVLYDVLDALAATENQTERDAIAMDLMGKSAQDLNPLILQGSDALRELAEEAEETGYILDESQIAKLGEVDDAYQRMQLQVEATKNQLALEFAPASKEAMETFGTVVQRAGQTLVDTHLIENLGAVVTNTMAIIDAVTSFTDGIPNWLNPINNFSKQFEGLAMILATVADAANLLSGLMPWNWGSGKASTALGWNIGSGQMSNLQKLKYSGDEYVSYNAAGTDAWRGGLTWVGEAGPELVALPRGSRIYNSGESRQMAAAGTDTSRIEALLERNVQLLETIGGEFAGLKVRRRMS